MAHDAVRSLAHLADDTGRDVILYDQIGCGASTHLPDAPTDFWTTDLFVDELHDVIDALHLDRYHLLGWSWGGMLAAEFAVRPHEGLSSLTICNAPASIDLYMAGVTELRRNMSPTTRAILARHEATGTLTDPEYLGAVAEFLAHHTCRIVPPPQDLVDAMARIEEDPTVCHTMYGPHRMHVTGTLREWTIVDRLHRIVSPTLVVAGEFDQVAPIAWTPFVDLVPNATSLVVTNASHCPHIEQPRPFSVAVASFLSAHE